MAGARNPAAQRRQLTAPTSPNRQTARDRERTRGLRPLPRPLPRPERLTRRATGRDHMCATVARADPRPVGRRRRGTRGPRDAPEPTGEARATATELTVLAHGPPAGAVPGVQAARDLRHAVPESYGSRGRTPTVAARPRPGADRSCS